MNKILTEAEMEFCEYWLRFYTAMARKLTTPIFTKESVSALIVYEANTRQRKHVLELLIGRYGKLIRREITKDIYSYMEVHDGYTREGYRRLSEKRNSQARWPSNKTNVV